MAIIAIVRITGGLHTSLRGYKEYSMTWSHILTQVEASVAVFMGSISAFRTIFVTRDPDEASRGFGLYRRLLSKLGISKQTGRSGESDDVKGNQPQIPEGHITNVSMKTLRKFIRGFNKQPGATSLESVTEVDVEDYHDYRRKDARPIRVNVDTEWQVARRNNSDEVSYH